MEALKLIVLVAVGGCGRLDFDALHGDAATFDAGACLGTGTFSNLAPVTAIDTPNLEYGSSISPDGLTLLWDEPVGAVEQLFVTTRTDRSSPFPAGAALEGAFPTGSQSDGSITADLLELYFESRSTGPHCLYRMTRASPTEAFANPVALSALCSTGDVVGAAISADGLTLAYNTSLDSFGEGDIYITVRPDRTSEFPVGKQVAGLPSTVGFPALSADRLRLWFEEDNGSIIRIRAGERISPSDNFTSYHDVTELDTQGDNGDISLTLDESEVYFSTKRGTTDWDVFSGSRPCL
ncbi:MAG TPA: hypothetical protein VFQ65_06465 [Kofleriaceae bacterium]|nr:hypothetical protein [Kofleriaceae bacterium]